MFDRPHTQKKRALIVHVQFQNQQLDQDDLIEFQDLTIAAGIEIVGLIEGSRHSPDAKYFVGSGKVEEIKIAVTAEHADLVLFNHSLSPTQQRNLEQTLGCHVVDRTGLILDIFAQRAHTFEGKLQVELAQLEHQSTRLVQGWTHLERQKGGIGLRGGPGETQLEVDRRLIADKIKKIKTQLIKVRKQRTQNRQARQRTPVPVIALVGYTNAGKSTLFNRLTGEDSYVADQLFATLDPTARRLVLPEIGAVVLIDTVGFIRHLPHTLVDAFRATLEETRQADLLLHVIDFSNPHRDDNIAEVETVLAEIEADNVPSLKVYNKIDLVVGLDPRQEDQAVYVAAAADRGIDLLKLSIQAILSQGFKEYSIVLKPAQAKLRASLYAKKFVLAEANDEAGNLQLRVRMSEQDYQKLFNARD